MPRPRTRATASPPAAPPVLALPEPAHAAAATTPQRISQAMTTAIVERRLMPGTKLVEQQIADIFQVSRTVVRQALNQLASDRLVALSPARGAFVCTPSVQVARRVFEVLAELLSRCSAAMPTPRWR